MSAINALKNFPQWGAAYTVCTNAETLGVQADGTGLTESDIVREALGAARGVIESAGMDYETDSFFPHWNGGKHAQFPEVRGTVCARIYWREICDIDDESDEPYGDWEHRREIPADVLTAVAAIASAANVAMHAKIERLCTADAAE